MRAHAKLAGLHVCVCVCQKHSGGFVCNYAGPRQGLWARAASSRGSSLLFLARSLSPPPGRKGMRMWCVPPCLEASEKAGLSLIWYHSGLRLHIHWIFKALLLIRTAVKKKNKSNYSMSVNNAHISSTGCSGANAILVSGVDCTTILGGLNEWTLEEVARESGRKKKD